MPDTTPQNQQPSPLSVADLNDDTWQDQLPNNPQADLEEYLAADARQAAAEGRNRAAAVLQLLAEACSLMLDGDTPAAPLRPWWIGSDGRSGPGLDSFSQDAVALFAELVPQVKHSALRARLADIVWCREPQRGLSFADLAIEAYVNSPLEAPGWQLGGRDAWLRAVYLALSLRRTGLVAEIEQRLQEVFWRIEQPEGTPMASYASLMFRHGLASDQHPKVAERLAELGSDLAARARYREARDLFAVAAEWLRRKGRAQRHAELVAAIAQAWHDEARSALAPPAASAIAAGDALDKALQEYRSIPRKHRPALGVDERITALQLERLDVGERSLAELGAVSTGPTDISALVRESVASVTGKDEFAALHALATVWPTPNVIRIEHAARETMEGTLFGRLFSRRSTMARDGRVISKVGGRSPEEDEARGLIVGMLEQFRLETQLAVQGGILPALDHVAIEHPLNLDSFITLARSSRLVPPDHARRVARALHFGYTRDFETALQYLASEVENIVRYHLKNTGAVTINTDKDGVQMELGLSSLVKMPQMEAFFRADLTFEIKALFCDQDGPNLRNDVAHGLIPDDDAFSIDSVYAWWFLFRMVFLTSPYARQAPPPEKGSEGKE